MLGLPSSTQYGKRIPKNRFTHGMTPALKRLFSEQVEAIYWRNKISPDTVNIAPAQSVEEIELIELALSQERIDKRILEAIDRAIPYHTVFVLSYKGREQLTMGYKQAAQADRYKVEGYYFSDWLPQGQHRLELKALSLDKLYEGWLKNLIPSQTEPSADIADTVNRQKEIDRLKRQCAALEKRIVKEKQFNVRVELNQELRELQTALSDFE